MKSINRFLIAFIIVMLVLILDKIDFKKIKVDNFFSNYIDSNLNILETAETFSNIFDEFIEDVEVSKTYYPCQKITIKKDYQEILLKDKVVLNLKEALVISIIKEKDKTYKITTQDLDGNLLIYKNLESYNVKIYQKINKDSLLGLAKDNKLIFSYLNKNNKQISEVFFIANEN